MTDRILRDELFDSQRWLDLPTDTDRLAYIALLPRADDFGNLEGGLMRLFRMFHSFTQIKTPEATAIMLVHLLDADLIRRYEVDGRELYHLPRFRPHRQYLVRKYPRSPWDHERKLGKTQRVEVRGLAKDHALTENLATTSLPSSSDVAQGVGVGVGVGVGGSKASGRANALPDGRTPPVSRPKATRLDKPWSLPDEWRDWAVKVHHLEPQRVVRMSLGFRDYWHAKPGRTATKLDWFATWRNWVRKECGDA